MKEIFSLEILLYENYESENSQSMVALVCIWFHAVWL